MADFSNYELAELNHGRGVYELADGLIPEMAEVFGVDLGDEPSSDALGKLVGEIGVSKVLQENIEHVQEVLGTQEDAIEIAARWTNRSGVQTALDRSLWTPEVATPRYLDGVVVTGAVANWQDRTADILEDRASNATNGHRLYIPVGNRVMKTPTEQVNENVVQFHEDHNGQYPTEAQYVETVILPRLADLGYDVSVEPQETSNGDEIAEEFVAQHPELFVNHSQLLFARVANAGIQLAVQFRKAAQQQYEEFDASRSYPQVFVATDSFPAAQSVEQTQRTKEFQNPMTAIRQVALTAKLLHEAAN